MGRLFALVRLSGVLSGAAVDGERRAGVCHACKRRPAPARDPFSALRREFGTPRRRASVLHSLGCRVAKQLKERSLFDALDAGAAVMMRLHS